MLLFILILELFTFKSFAKNIDDSVFNRDFKKRVDFWVRVNTELSIHEGLIFDSHDLSTIYKVFDLRKQSVEQAKQEVYDDLLKRHQQNPQGAVFLRASHYRRLRFQKGQKEVFEQAMKRAEALLPEMEKIFTSQGIPKEYTRIPYVESSFNPLALSKVGASGLWQLMPKVNEFFLDTVVMNGSTEGGPYAKKQHKDFRNNPLEATRMAAQLLKVNYDILGDWPLAITAYNHGRQSLLRLLASSQSETLEQLLVQSHTRKFGFASRNFYANLLAAIEAEKYFLNQRHK
jgi:membrane-bound lytic murein transglycosylase D